MARYTYKNLLVVAMIVISTISIEAGWKFFLEKSVRIQARYNLTQIQTCVNDLVLRANGSVYDEFSSSIDNYQLEKALKTCARDMRTSPTGDVFAYDLVTKDFVFDLSLECYAEGGKRMTIESECSLHHDKEMCATALKMMNTGYNSSPELYTSWKFYKDVEFLEWKILPYKNIGFDGIERGGKLVPYQLVVVQGSQRSELYNRYKGFRIMLYVIALISILLNLSLSFHELKIPSTRRRDDLQRGS